MIELAFLRNQLLSGYADEKLIINLLDNIRNNDYMFKDVILQSLHNCINDIQKEDYQSAANEIYLVHNLPLDKDDFSKWDQWSFYVIQMPTYLDNINDEKRVKKLIRMLAEYQNIYEQQL